MAMLDVFRESVGRAMEFYQSYGLEVREPRIRYIPEPYPPDMRAIALTVDGSGFEPYNDFFFRTILSQYVKFMGLELSDEASQEIARLFEGRKTLPPAFYEGDADIFLFPPYGNVHYNPRKRDRTAAHEVWHLIEMYYDVVRKTIFICEGTATYAGRSFVGESCDEPPKEIVDLSEMLYSGAAHVVQGFVAGTENPYKAMLSPLREKMQEVLMPKVSPLIKGATGLGSYRWEILYLLNQIPEYRELRDHLSRDRIIEVHKELGAYRLADELANQDLSPLIRQLSNLGF